MSANASEWNERKNERRCELIRKKFAHGIGADEADELAELQQELAFFRRQAAPLPYDAVDAIEVALRSPSS